MAEEVGLNVPEIVCQELDDEVIEIVDCCTVYEPPFIWMMISKVH